MEPPEDAAVVSESAKKRILRQRDSIALEEARDQIFGGYRHDIVDEMQRSMESTTLTDDKSVGIQVAMARLEDEFGNILIAHTNSIETDPSSSSIDSIYRSTDSILQIDVIPSEAIYVLRSIAEKMISAGYADRCLHVYSGVRKPAVEELFRRLGVEELSTFDIHRMEWEALATKISQWIAAARVCVRVVCASEKNLCERIFQGLGTGVDKDCFIRTVEGSAIRIFKFAVAVSTSRQSPEKLFRILDLYDALLDLLPDVPIVFQSSTTIRVQVMGIQFRLVAAVRKILMVFKDEITLRRPWLPPDRRDGSINPLTINVMNYTIILVSDYKQTLKELLFLVALDPHRSLKLYLTSIIVSLLLTLKDDCEGQPLYYLYMMNNVNYIVKKIRSSPELSELIENDLVEDLIGEIHQGATSYYELTWGRVLHCLRDEGIHVDGKFSKSVLRKRFKTFNLIFEEVHRNQATWLIPDAELRGVIRRSNSDELIRAYRSFLDRFGSLIGSRKQREKYIKYSPEQLETALLDFFKGYPVPQPLRRR